MPLTRGRMCLAVGALLLLSACGSTAQLGSESAMSAPNDGGLSAGGPATDGLSNAGTTGGLATTTGRGARTTGSSLSSGGVPSTRTANTTIPGGTTTGGTDGLPANGKVQVGLINLTGYGSALSSLGFPGIDTGDMKAQGDAIVKYINDHGGLLGHPIDPVYFTYDVASSSSSSYDNSLYQAACSRWTEDSHVLAGTWPGGLSDATLPSCMQAHNAGLVQISVGGTTDRELAGWPLISAPVWISMERAYRLLVQRLAAQSYFKGATVGLVRFDTPEMALIQHNVIEPELRRYGVTLKESVALKNPDSTSDISSSSSEVQAAILKFRSAGVDHVMFEDFSRLAATEWLPSAQSAGYMPRYGLTSDSGPAYLTANGDASALRGAIGIGWNPSEAAGDTTPAQNPLSGNAAQKRCFKIMRDAHQAMQDAGTRQTALQQCEVLFDLKAIVEAGGSATPAGITHGLNALPRGPVSGATFGWRLGPQRHAGAAYVRDLYLDDACDCFKYRGPLRPVP